MKRIISLIILAALVLSPCILYSCGGEGPEGGSGSAQETEAGRTIFVSPDGSDDADGSELAPLASAAGAVELIRSIKKDGGLPEGGIDVVFSAGTYSVNEKTVLDADVSGTEDSPVTFRAADGADVVFTGAVVLDPSLFVPASDEIKEKITDEGAKVALLQIDLKAAGCYDHDDSIIYTGGWTCFQYRQELFIDGKRQDVARWPNGKYEESSFTCDGGEDAYIIVPEEKTEAWAGEKALRYYGYLATDWSAMNYQEDTVHLDADRSAIVMKKVGGVENGSMTRYFVYNLFCELDAPGEYYWDTDTGMLYYYPDGDLKDRTIEFNQYSENWFILDGASDITFRGITFENARASIFDGTADRFTIDSCVFRELGGFPARINGSRNTVTGCEMHDLASGGILLTGGSTTDKPGSGCVVMNNYIHDWSQVYTVYSHAVSVNGYGFLVSHNELCTSPHAAIAFNCGNSVIEYNYLHDLCRETGDAGAVYAGARWDWSGNEIRYNFLKDVRDVNFNGTPNGIYLDDMLSGQHIYGNVLVNIGGAGIAVGSGKNILAENNIFVNTGHAAIGIDSKGMSSGFHEAVRYPHGHWGKITGEKAKADFLSDFQRLAYPMNILNIENSGEDSNLFGDDPGVPSYYRTSYNIAFGCEKFTYVDCRYDIGIVSFDGRSVNNVDGTSDGVVQAAMEVNRYGEILGNILYDADPGFTDPENGDYSLREDSRVFRDLPGFENLYTLEAGVTKN